MRISILFICFISLTFSSNVFAQISGCTDSLALNFNPLATIDDSSCCAAGIPFGTQIGLDIDGETASDWSGASVSLSADGSTRAIGAHRNDGNTGSAADNRGHVRVYQKVVGYWSQVGQDINGETAGDFSGFSVSLSADGSILAIGAYNNDGTGSNAGHVRVYQNVGGTWTQVGVDINGEASLDES